MGKEDGREKQEEGETDGPLPCLFRGGFGGMWTIFSSTKHFFKCGELVATVARELFSIYLTHPLLRRSIFFALPQASVGP